MDSHHALVHELLAHAGRPMPPRSVADALAGRLLSESFGVKILMANAAAAITLVGVSALSAQAIAQIIGAIGTLITAAWPFLYLHFQDLRRRSEAQDRMALTETLIKAGIFNAELGGIKGTQALEKVEEVEQIVARMLGQQSRIQADLDQVNNPVIDALIRNRERLGIPLPAVPPRPSSSDEIPVAVPRPRPQP